LPFFHCTLGDVLIAPSTLMLALIAAGDDGWPARRFWPVAAAAIVCAVAYTVFSEWRNVVVRASWAYSEWMPVVRPFGLTIGHLAAAAVDLCCQQRHSRS